MKCNELFLFAENLGAVGNLLYFSVHQGLKTKVLETYVKLRASLIICGDFVALKIITNAQTLTIFVL